MIVPMSKVFLVARAADRRKLLEALAELGAIHLKAVDPAHARADEKTVGAIDRLGRAVQVLTEVSPTGQPPDLAPEAAAAEVLDLQRAQAERRSRLARLHHQYEHLELWGDLRLEQLKELTDAGLTLRFASVPAKQLDTLRADCVQVIRPLERSSFLVALVDRGEPAALPDEAVELPHPVVDRPSIRAEAARIDQELRAAGGRLAELANLIPAMQAARRELQTKAAFTIADRSGLAEEALYAVQGWVPADRAQRLGRELAALGLHTAVHTLKPDEQEQPPTLVRYPRWARPIAGLFEILDTHPGYREMDVSGFFMIALPLFAAMLIGDAGYGLLFTVAALAFYSRLVAKVGAAKVQLLMVFGLTTLAFGVLSATYFGVTPETLGRAGGYVSADGRLDEAALMRGTDGWATAARVTRAVAPLWSADPQVTRTLLIKISLIIGTVHLTLARIRRAVFLAPSQVFLAEIGWMLILWGMLGVVWMLFFRAEMPVPLGAVYAVLAGGGVLVVLFGMPRRNPLARVGLGLASALLPTLGAFSDTVSYIRLMAVGMATYYIAHVFNTLSAQLAAVITWFGAAPILVLGHALNIALAVIAIFAHGVRLNMLEFSSNAGVQWSGYPYEPFATQCVKES